MKTPDLTLHPCDGCDSPETCRTAEDYLCPRFRAEFIRVWDETTAYLREVLDHVSEHP